MSASASVSAQSSNAWRWCVMRNESPVVWAPPVSAARRAVCHPSHARGGLQQTDQAAKCPPRRTFNRELRILVHEIGHVLIARLRDAVVTSVSIVADDVSEGRVMGAWPFKAFARGDVD